MHVCAERLFNRNASVSGYDNEWTFMFYVSLRGASAPDEELVGAKADPGLFTRRMRLPKGWAFCGDAN